MRVVRRLAGGHAVGRGAIDRIEHLPTRRSFGVFVNLLVGSLGLVDLYTKLWRLQVGPLVTWLDESVNLVWARLPVPPRATSAYSAHASGSPVGLALVGRISSLEMSASFASGFRLSSHQNTGNLNGNLVR